MEPGFLPQPVPPPQPAREQPHGRNAPIRRGACLPGGWGGCHQQLGHQSSTPHPQLVFAFGPWWARTNPGHESPGGFPKWHPHRTLRIPGGCHC